MEQLYFLHLFQVMRFIMLKFVGMYALIIGILVQRNGINLTDVFGMIDLIVYLDVHSFPFHMW